MATIQALQNLGFQFVGGKIDRNHKTYGFLSPDGPILTPEGEEIVAAAVAERMVMDAPEPSVAYAVPTGYAPRRGRPPKV